MDKIVSVVKLMAKTGLFFANADGQYSDREAQYLNDFIGGIEQIGDLDEALRQEVKGALGHAYTHEEIFAETEALLDGFNSDERKAIVASIRGFINKVIRADGKVHPTEEAHYKAWKEAFGA